VFYGYWSIKYVPLLSRSVTFNFACGRSISKRAQAREGRWLLIFAISADLLLLSFYKYADFFLTSLNDLAGALLPMPALVLPIGISFFTFTQIAFLVDAYRGWPASIASLTTFCSTISSWPQPQPGYCTNDPAVRGTSCHRAETRRGD
jgi:alginate O-acetyltransferase complex protein AlgI